jgi:hypothetical protein
MSRQIAFCTTSGRKAIITIRAATPSDMVNDLEA